MGDICQKEYYSLQNITIKEQKMKIGDRVRVKESVIVYHYPEQKSRPFDIKGMEGEISNIMTDWEGRPISPNLPILVNFTKKFKAHLKNSEIEVI